MERSSDGRNAVFARLSASLILYILLNLLLSWLTSFLRLEGAAAASVQTLVYSVSIIAAVTAAYPRKETLSLFSPPKGFSFAKQLVVFFGVLLLCVLINLGVNALLGAAGISSNGVSLVFEGFGELAVLFVKYVILSAVLEELLFRGVFISSLRVYGNGFAVIVSALVFALSHTAVSSVPSAFLFGLFFGFLFVKTNSLVPSIIFHLINNAAAFLLQYLAATDSVAYTAFFVSLLTVSAVAGIICIYFFIKKKGGAFIEIIRDRRLSPLSFFCNFFSAAWLAFALLLILRGMETVK